MKNALFATKVPLLPVVPPPNGQMNFSGSSKVFTVPAGVTSLCVAMVGKGQNASAFKSGNGGNLRWINDIPVVPGQTYAIDANLGSAFGYTVNSAVGGKVNGVNGSPGLTVTGTNSSQGGNAGGFTGGSYKGAGINLSSWTYTMAYQNGYSDGAPSGGGGGCYRNARPDLCTTYGGAAGAIRVIWGKDRGFPNKKIFDMV